MSAKNKGKAEDTKGALAADSTGDTGGTVAPCKAQKHFIKIVVQDPDGNPVTDVRPTLEVDGNTISVALSAEGKYDSKKVLDSDDDAKITFPKLFNCDWWPSDGTKPTPAGEVDLAAVAEGDCIVRMAHVAGYRDYTDIWDAPENATKKTDRPNPNSLLAGDVFKGPEKKDKSVDKAVDAEWTFIVKALKKPKLRVVVIDKELKPLANAAWKLTGVAKLNGTTGADGLIEVPEIDPKAIKGTLVITPNQPQRNQVAKPAAAPLPDPPPYPLPLNEENFVEKKPSKIKPFLKELKFDLKIGGLPAHKDETGTFARMHNMGFLRALDASDEDVALCVKAYQKIALNNDNGSGAHADIKDDIETRHTVKA
ncbi:hypothetical protein F183_A10730 [Bryobacterales bacterium F-183]|nr:hypothetical protein F183_A10730 [Bryobacterales bacterium F-183]